MQCDSPLPQFIITCCTLSNQVATHYGTQVSAQGFQLK